MNTFSKMTLASVSFAAVMATGSVVMAQAEKPMGQGTLNSIDAKEHKLNITHGPIPALKWPGMTMDFGVAPGVDAATLKAGSKITFTLSRGADGMWMIDSVKAAE